MTDPIELTKKETELMQHALGVSSWRDSNGVSNRNYFNADINSPDYHTWIGLVNRGVATMKEYPLAKNSVNFSVCDHVKKQLGVKKEIA